jgi:hypothetical protein
VPVPLTYSAIALKLAILRSQEASRMPSIFVFGRGLLPRCDCCAFFASHHSGPFLPQRDPENPVRLMRTNRETKPR